MESASFSRLVHPLERLISGFDYDFVERHHIIPLLAFRRALPLLMESSRLSNLPLANASPRPSFDSFLRVLDETDVNHSVIPRGLSALQIDGYCSARIPLRSDVIIHGYISNHSSTLFITSDIAFQLGSVLWLEDIRRSVSVNSVLGVTGGDIVFRVSSTFPLHTHEVPITHLVAPFAEHFSLPWWLRCLRQTSYWLNHCSSRLGNDWVMEVRRCVLLLFFCWLKISFLIDFICKVSRSCIICQEVRFR